MNETSAPRRPQSIRLLVWVMAVGSVVTYISGIWTSHRPVSAAVVDLVVLWLFGYLIWRGSSLARWIITLLGMLSVVLNIATLDEPTIWWLLRVLIPLTVGLLLWLPRQSRQWFRQQSPLFTRPRPDDYARSDHTSLPAGHGSVSVLLTPPPGPLQPIWDAGTPYLSIDGQTPYVVGWGSIRLILECGTHQLHIYVKLAPEFGDSSGVGQRQLLVTERSDLAVEYKPSRVPGFSGHIVDRRSPASAGDR